MKRKPALPEWHDLSAPKTRGSVRLEQVILRRRSVRAFEPEPLNERQLSQLLWATQGVTGDDGLRAAPSAGALYPLEIYVATTDALQRYDPQRHAVRTVRLGDLRPRICSASLNQAAIRQAPAVFVIAAIYERTAKKYGERWGRRYVDMEVGHAAQNLLLQAVALGLGAVPIAAFYEDRVRSVLGLPEHEEPRYVIPVGHPR